MTPQPSLCHLHPILQPAKPNHRAGGKGSKTHSEGAAGSGVPPGNCPASRRSSCPQGSLQGALKLSLAQSDGMRVLPGCALTPCKGSPISVIITSNRELWLLLLQQGLR